MIQPIKDRVVIKSDDKKEMTKGGIVLPAAAQSEHYTGEVLAVGPLVQELEVGNKVIYSRYAGIDIEPEPDMADGELLILREPDVLAVKQ